MARRWLIIVCAALLYGGAQAQAWDGVARLTLLSKADCFIEVEAETRCGTLSLPENPAQPAGTQVSIPFLIVPAQTATPAASPILYFEGGPGGSGTMSYEFWLTSALRAHSDIILFDQRGTGYATPSLDCDDYWDGDDYTLYDRQCAEALREQGIDLAAYTSASAARDVQALMQALSAEFGYPSYNLFGVSYGTRLALTVLRDAPSGVRSLILDSVYPPEVNFWEGQVRNGLRAFSALYDACAADLACDAAFPNLGKVFLQAVETLNAEPLVIVDGQSCQEVAYTGYDLVSDFFLNLYDSTLIPYLPAWLYAAAARDPYFQDVPYLETNEALCAELSAEDLADLWNADVGVDGDSEGVYLSVDCGEELPFNDPERILDGIQGVKPALLEALYYDIALAQANCDSWGMPPPAPREAEAVVSDVPALVLAGALDPITPPAWAESAASHLPQSQFYVFPLMGHGVVDSAPCPSNLALRFLADPNAPLDAGCIVGMQQLEWYVP